MGVSNVSWESLRIWKPPKANIWKDILMFNSQSLAICTSPGFNRDEITAAFITQPNMMTKKQTSFELLGQLRGSFGSSDGCGAMSRLRVVFIRRVEFWRRSCRRTNTKDYTRINLLYYTVNFWQYSPKTICEFLPTPRLRLAMKSISDNDALASSSRKTVPGTRGWRATSWIPKKPISVRTR